MGLLINFINLNNYFYLFIFILMISLHVIFITFKEILYILNIFYQNYFRFFKIIFS